eukprot:TRINITY_DN971_c0_g1_i2.p1 TRINITY_DN971_c0_g1~~TRINITY_DN971_c0_g1_i2.p1  ORF type:complete len:1951 (+),score=493.96 TRINITY_DN971_c0_g1_i2:29-5854(+)
MFFKSNCILVWFIVFLTCYGTVTHKKYNYMKNYLKDSPNSEVFNALNNEGLFTLKKTGSFNISYYPKSAASEKFGYFYINPNNNSQRTKVEVFSKLPKDDSFKTVGPFVKDTIIGFYVDIPYQCTDPNSKNKKITCYETFYTDRTSNTYSTPFFAILQDFYNNDILYMGLGKESHRTKLLKLCKDGFNANSFAKQFSLSGQFIIDFDTDTLERYGHTTVDGYPVESCDPLVGTKYYREMDDALMKRIKKAMPSNKKVNPLFIDPTKDANIHFLTEGYVNFTFLYEGAGYKNQVGYFTYDPETFEIKEERIIFGDTSFRTDCLKTGDSSRFGPFPAGTNMGFFIRSNGASNPYNYKYYSLQRGPIINPDKKHHVAIFKDNETGTIVTGFEDLYNQGDGDFEDVVFTVHTEASIDTGNTVEIDGDGETIDKPDITSTVTNGTTEFASGDNSSPDRVDSSSMDGDYTVPSGWDIAGADNATIDVIISKPWGCHCMILSDLNCYSTQNGTVLGKNKNPIVIDSNNNKTIIIHLDNENVTKKILVSKDLNMTAYNKTKSNDVSTSCMSCCITHYVVPSGDGIFKFWGYEYAVLDGTAYNKGVVSDCELKINPPLQIPQGWELAVYDEVTKIVLSQTDVIFGINYVVTKEGYKISTLTGEKVSTCTGHLIEFNFSKKRYMASDKRIRVLLRRGTFQGDITPDQPNIEIKTENDTYAALDGDDLFTSVCQDVPFGVPVNYSIAIYNETTINLMKKGTFGTSCLFFADKKSRRYVPNLRDSSASIVDCDNELIETVISNVTFYSPLRCPARVLMIKKRPPKPAPVIVPEVKVEPPKFDMDVEGRHGYVADRIKTFEGGYYDVEAGNYTLLKFDFGIINARIENIIGMTGIEFTLKFGDVEYNVTVEGLINHTTNALPRIKVNGTVITSFESNYMNISCNGKLHDIGYPNIVEASSKNDFSITIETKFGVTIVIGAWDYQQVMYLDEMPEKFKYNNRHVLVVDVELAEEYFVVPTVINSTTLNITTGRLHSDYTSENIVITSGSQDILIPSSGDVSMKVDLVSGYVYDAYRLLQLVNDSTQIAQDICERFGLDVDIEALCVKEILKTKDPKTGFTPVYKYYFIEHLYTQKTCDILNVTSVNVTAIDSQVLSRQKSISFGGYEWFTINQESPSSIEHHQGESIALDRLVEIAPWSPEARAIAATAHASVDSFILGDHRTVSSRLSPNEPKGKIVRSGPRGQCLRTTDEHLHILTRTPTEFGYPSIFNPSFEDDVLNWEIERGDWVITTNASRSGKKSLFVRVNNSTNGTFSISQKKTVHNMKAPFAVRCYSKSVDADEVKFHNFYQPSYSIVVKVEYSDSTEDLFFNNYHLQTHDFEPSIVEVIPSKEMTSFSVILQVQNMTGEFWFDDVSIIRPSTNLLLNPSFDLTVINEWFPLNLTISYDGWEEIETIWLRDDHRYAQFWEGYGGSAYDCSHVTVVPRLASSRGWSLLMNRTTQEQRDKGEHGARQVLILNQTSSSSQMVYLGGWSKSFEVNANESVRYSMVMDIIFQDGTKILGQTITFPTQTHEYVYRDIAVEIDGAVKEVIVYCRFKESGIVWFDEVYLTILPLETGKHTNLRGVFGDPHILTFDDELYEMQEGGEYVLTHYKRTLINTRYQKISADASVTKAVAIRFEEDKIEVIQESGSETPKLYINGRLNMLFDQKLQDNTVITIENIADQPSIVIQYNKNLVRIDSRKSINGNYLVVLVSLSEEHKGVVRGLMCDYDGAKTCSPRNEGEAFAESWRLEVNDDLNLFTPELRPTTSLDSFNADSTASVNVLTYDEAKKNCLENGGANAGKNDASLINDEMLETCIFDLMNSGDVAFSDNLYLLQSTLQKTEASIYVESSSILETSYLKYYIGGGVVICAILSILAVVLIFKRKRKAKRFLDNNSNIRPLNPTFISVNPKNKM